ncbi:transposase-like zinc-binding domain-containing protein, partial [Corynebacterium striatum]|uniref:transposase-like zinc-binding domain-containing protein n=1 Tax=Corynebacterium striatum TaxID=43770 RepID=UPI003B5A0236
MGCPLNEGNLTVCSSKMKRNGTTSKGTTRWRCTTCGASSTNTRPDRAYAANF